MGQLRAAGVDSAAINRRLKRGRLFRVGRGVYAVGHTALSREGEFLREVLIAGEGAALSHEACAEHWAVRRRRAPLIDVVAPADRRPRTRARVHKATLHPDDVTVHRGIPCTTIARLVREDAHKQPAWRAAGYELVRVRDPSAVAAVVDARLRSEREPSVFRVPDCK